MLFIICYETGLVNSGHTVARDIGTHIFRTSWFASVLPECSIPKNIYMRRLVLILVLILSEEMMGK